MANSGNQKAAIMGAVLVGALAGGAEAASDDYASLLSLFHDWRAFEHRACAPVRPITPPRRWRASMRSWRPTSALRGDRFQPVAHRQQVDYQLVRAEMNGLDFDLRVLKPWARDPAFYHSLRTEQSDTPSHEGPNHYGLIELWSYRFPLSRPEEQRLTRELAVIAPSWLRPAATCRQRP